MRALAIVVSSVILFASASISSAKDQRDGSTYERAIIVPPATKRYVDWEWDYLEKRLFDGHAMPKEHALLEHKGRIYDRFVFTTRAGDKVVIFDVTSFHPGLAEKLRDK